MNQLIDQLADDLAQLLKLANDCTSESIWTTTNALNVLLPGHDESLARSVLRALIPLLQAILLSTDSYTQRSISAITIVFSLMGARMRRPSTHTWNDLRRCLMWTRHRQC